MSHGLRQTVFWLSSKHGAMNNLFAQQQLKTGKTLAVMVAKGLARVEDFDKPALRPRGDYAYVELSRQQSLEPCDWTNPKQKVPWFNKEGDSYDTYPKPCLEYPTQNPYRNLCREWIDANPKDWEAMQQQYNRPATVQAGPSPRDFEPAAEADRGAGIRPDHSHVLVEGSEDPSVDYENIEF